MRISDRPADGLTVPDVPSTCFGWAPSAFHGTRMAVASSGGSDRLALPYRTGIDGRTEAVLRYRPFVVLDRDRDHPNRPDRSAEADLIRHVADQEGSIRLGELNPAVYRRVRDVRGLEVVRAARTHLHYPLAADPSAMDRRTRRSVTRAGRAPWKVELGSSLGSAEAWRRVVEIEHGSWKHAEHSSIPARPEQNRFFEEFLTLEGRSFVAVSHLDGVPVAHIIGARWRHVAMLMKWTYKAEFRASAPGFHLMWWVLRWLDETGTRVVDFCSNDSGFASGFANHSMTRRTVVIS